MLGISGRMRLSYLVWIGKTDSMSRHFDDIKNGMR
jgi:hypothetical protein